MPTDFVPFPLFVQYDPLLQVASIGVSSRCCRYNSRSVRLALGIIWSQAALLQRVVSSGGYRMSLSSKIRVARLHWHLRLLWLLHSCLAFSSSQAVLSQFYCLRVVSACLSLFADTSCTPPRAGTVVIVVDGWTSRFPGAGGFCTHRTCDTVCSSRRWLCLVCH